MSGNREQTIASIGKPTHQRFEHDSSHHIQHIDFSWLLDCSTADSGGHPHNSQRMSADKKDKKFELTEDILSLSRKAELMHDPQPEFIDDPEPEPEGATFPPASPVSERYNGAQCQAQEVEADHVSSKQLTHRHQPASERDPEYGFQMKRRNSDLDARDDDPFLEFTALAESIFSLGLSSLTSCVNIDNYSRESSFCDGFWDSAFAWRFCKAWEDKGPAPCPLMLSPCIEEEPVILCCAWGDRWWPLSVDRTSTVGSYFFLQGHALKLMSDYTDLYTMNVTKSVAGDPTQISFRSAEHGNCVQCIGNQLSEGKNMASFEGPWGKLQLRPALQGNYYCFHLYAAASFTDAMTGASSSALPICFDEVNGCLVQGEPEPGCEPAVFALQTASSAHLLEEIVDLTRESYKQKSKFSGLNILLQMQILACKDSAQEARLQKQMNKRDAEEERLVFLEDNLDFLNEQLQSNLADAGADAAHGLPEACVPDSMSSVSTQAAKSLASDSSLESLISSWLSPDPVGPLSRKSVSSTTLKSSSSSEAIVSSFREKLRSNLADPWADVADIGGFSVAHADSPPRIYESSQPARPSADVVDIGGFCAADSDSPRRISGSSKSAHPWADVADISGVCVTDTDSPLQVSESSKPAHPWADVADIGGFCVADSDCPYQISESSSSHELFASSSQRCFLPLK